MTLYVPHDVVVRLEFGGPGCGEAARHQQLPKSPITIEHYSDNERTNERPNKYAEQWLSSYVASNEAK